MLRKGEEEDKSQSCESFRKVGRLTQPRGCALKEAVLAVGIHLIKRIIIPHS